MNPLSQSFSHDNSTITYLTTQKQKSIQKYDQQKNHQMMAFYYESGFTLGEEIVRTFSLGEILSSSCSSVST